MTLTTASHSLASASMEARVRVRVRVHGLATTRLLCAYCALAIAMRVPLLGDGEDRVAHLHPKPVAFELRSTGAHSK